MKTAQSEVDSTKEVKKLYVVIDLVVASIPVEIDLVIAVDINKRTALKRLWQVNENEPGLKQYLDNQLTVLKNLFRINAYFRRF